MIVQALVAAVELENVFVGVWDHKQTGPIPDSWQVVIETETVAGAEVGMVIQDVYGDETGYRREAFSHTIEDGCRELTLFEEILEGGA
ncbi:hypothetical protein [Halorarum salinum]|uniref:Uncharacterized protein n=1 Tax=Halorarum salinum TaxID=2743089 RepID=A0A7D5LAT8_9EURY|nr:hypothetical protein [Halobaculum salinum]QLG62067.1 hypothetical protein HUG12_10140 [Halobaculum salinum]